MAAGKWVLEAVLLGVVTAATAYGLDQWRAAGEESRRIALFEASELAPLTAVGVETTAEPGAVLRAQLRGDLDPQRHVLVPHLLPDGRLGYDVWTPLRFRSGTSMGEFAVINRGWVPQAAATSTTLLAPAATDVEIEGLWIEVPASDTEDVSLEACASDAWPKVVTKAQPSYADMKCLFNAQQIAQGIVLMTSRLDSAIENDWIGWRRAVESSHRRNGWLGFGGAVVALVLMLSLLVFGRRTPRPRPTPAPVATARPLPEAKGRLAR